ncbi:glycosyltransferase, exosortase A system-associated [Bowmanella sp. Y26]|uniref:TIGR04063 family PEP-CTERM/XrtA system glycosyltransferase n=1 Tax=Bowmanella yangjiangensis TaxID=2811230 RepID=UPI001BDCB5B7|nr:glycosyltransferase, exosortase A system-associated [Bowmanella yangjiangensis]
MKVLHVLDHSIPLHSGYAFRTRNILLYQRALGITTCHLTSAKQGDVAQLEEDVDGLHFYRCPPLPEIYGGIKAQWAVVRNLTERLLAVAEREKPDILHAHSSALNGVAAIRVGKRLGIPVVYEIRAFWEDAAVDNGTCKEWGLRYRITRAMETWVLKRAQHVTCICEGLRQDILARGIAADKVTVIPNAVNLEEFSLIDSRDPHLEAQWHLQGKQVVGFIGSFYALEGLDVLLQGFALALQQNPNLHCLIVGGGKEEARLKALTEQLQLADKVTFTGRVPHQDVDGYYSLIDLLLYPRKSKRITELVTPLKPLEAMAMGRDFAASDVGGHKELIEHGQTGLLFKADSAEAICETIINGLARSDVERQQMRQQALAYVQNERNWAKSVSHYPALYQALL